MDSRFYLTFKDPSVLEDYNKQRQKEISKLSALILVERILFLTIIVTNFISSPVKVNIMRMVYFSIGLGIHILAMLALRLKKQWLFAIHAPIVILSHMLHVFNTKLGDDQIIAIYGQMIILIVAVMILNMNWILTSAAIIIAFFAWCMYLGLTCKIYVGVLAP